MNEFRFIDDNEFTLSILWSALITKLESRVNLVKYRSLRLTIFKQALEIYCVEEGKVYVTRVNLVHTSKYSNFFLIFF